MAKLFRETGSLRKEEEEEVSVRNGLQLNCPTRINL
jgi:hypothetical protein